MEIQRKVRTGSDLLEEDMEIYHFLCVSALEGYLVTLWDEFRRCRMGSWTFLALKKPRTLRQTRSLLSYRGRPKMLEMDIVVHQIE